MQSTNPESMTTEERTAELASILALGLVHAVRSTRLRVSLSSKEVSQSSPASLEARQDADLSVSALGPIGGPKPKPDPEASKGGSCDRIARNRNR